MRRARTVLALLPAGCIVLACTVASRARIIAEWARGIAVEFVDPPLLEKRVAEAARVPFRRPMARRTWAPASARRNPRLRRLLDAVQGLPDLTVAAWGRATRLTRFQLNRICVHAAGMPPERMIWLYMRAYAAREVALGTTEADMARMLGLSGAYALRRTLRRRWNSPSRARRGPRRSK